MYLNYANRNVSKASLFLLGILSALFSTITVAQYFYLPSSDMNFVFMFGAISIGFILIFLYRIYIFVTETKALESSFNIKKVTFLPNEVDFKFFQPQYDIICDYSQIENIELIITTESVRTKYRTKIVVTELTINFTILNNKTITIKNTPMNYMRVIYSLIDFGKKAKNFSWSFDGVGVSADIAEKIRDYSEKGLKQVLAKGEEDNMKIMSITFFVLGVIFAYQAKDAIDLIQLERSAPILIMPVFLIGLSLIFDVILLIDKLREENHKIL